MRLGGISEQGFKRLARKVGQDGGWPKSEWQSRFDDPAMEQPAEVDTSQIQSWVESLSQEIENIQSVQPVEAIQNLQAWVEYLNNEIESLKAGTQNAAAVPEYPNYDEIENAFSGEQGNPNANAALPNSFWDTLKNYLSGGEPQPTQQAQAPSYYSRRL